MTPTKGRIYAPASPVFMKKSPSKNLNSSKVSQRSAKKLVPEERSRKKSSAKTPIKVERKLKQERDSYGAKEEPSGKFISKEYIH